MVCRESVQDARHRDAWSVAMDVLLRELEVAQSALDAVRSRFKNEPVVSSPVASQSDCQPEFEWHVEAGRYPCATEVAK